MEHIPQQHNSLAATSWWCVTPSCCQIHWRLCAPWSRECYFILPCTEPSKPTHRAMVINGTNRRSLQPHRQLPSSPRSTARAARELWPRRGRGRWSGAGAAHGWALGTGADRSALGTLHRCNILRQFEGEGRKKEEKNPQRGTRQKHMFRAVPLPGLAGPGLPQPRTSAGGRRRPKLFAAGGSPGQPNTASACQPRGPAWGEPGAGAGGRRAPPSAAVSQRGGRGGGRHRLAGAPGAGRRQGWRRARRRSGTGAESAAGKAGPGARRDGRAAESGATAARRRESDSGGIAAAAEVNECRRGRLLRCCPASGCRGREARAGRGRAVRRLGPGHRPPPWRDRPSGNAAAAS